MSDDAIISSSQFSANAEANRKLDKSAGADPQDNDFKQFISQEENRLQSGNRKSAKNTDTDADTSGVENSSLKKSDEASAGQKGEGVSGSSGNTLPNLALHGGALAVGRVIYTTQSATVTSESLSKFMARQGLVSETLMEGQVETGGQIPETEIPNGGSEGENLLHRGSVEAVRQTRSEPFSDTTNRFLLTKGLLARGTDEGNKPIISPNETLTKSDFEGRKLESEEAKSIAQRLVLEGKNGPETGLHKVESKAHSEPFLQPNRTQTTQAKNVTVEPIHTEKVGFPEISRPQLSQAFWQNKSSNETADLEEPLGDRLAIDKDLKEGPVHKSGLSVAKNDGEAKFHGSNGLTEKDQYLMMTDRTSEMQKEKQSQPFLTQQVLEINARKTQREMSQNSPPQGLLARGTDEGNKPIISPNETLTKSDFEGRKLESEEAKSIAQRLVLEGKNGPETGLHKVESKAHSEPFLQPNRTQTTQAKNVTVEPIHTEKVGFPEISRPQLSQAFWQNKSSNETADLEEPLGDRLAIDKDLKEGPVHKSGLSVAKNDGEAKFHGSNGLTEKDQYLMMTDRTSEMQKEKQSQPFLTQQVLEINARKTQREMSQNSPQESSYADAGQSRVEFKGALREAQRLVSAGNLNNLTDSYESWSSRFGEVLAHRIAGYINKETWSVHFRLNPASLGEISLEIDFNEKGLEGRFGSNEESTRQLLQDTLPKLRIALRDILEENQGLKFDVGDNESSNRDSNREREASNGIAEELNFESEVLVGRTMDPELGSMVGLDILV